MPSAWHAAIDALEHCPMGAAAITTSGFPIDRTSHGQSLGVRRPARETAYGCIASVDYITGLYSAMKLVFLHLGRVVQDMAFWSSFEVGQFMCPMRLCRSARSCRKNATPSRSSICATLASVTCGTVRYGHQHDAQHAVHRHERQRRRGSASRLRRVRQRWPRVWIFFTAFLARLHDQHRKCAPQFTDAACITITELADTLVRDEALDIPPSP